MDMETSRSSNIGQGILGGVGFLGRQYREGRRRGGISSHGGQGRKSSDHHNREKRRKENCEENARRLEYRVSGGRYLNIAPGARKGEEGVGEMLEVRGIRPSSERLQLHQLQLLVLWENGTHRSQVLVPTS